MNKNNYYLLLILSAFQSCGNRINGSWKCEGGMVDGLEFLKGDQVILELMGAKLTTSFVINNDTMNIKTDKADIVFKISGEELVGEKYFGLMNVGNCKKDSK